MKRILLVERIRADLQPPVAAVLKIIYRIRDIDCTFRNKTEFIGKLEIPDESPHFIKN